MYVEEVYEPTLWVILLFLHSITFVGYNGMCSFWKSLARL